MLASRLLRSSSTQAVSYAPRAQNSIFGALFRSRAPRVPLTQEFPGLPQITPSQTPQMAETPTITTLANGLRVASIDSDSVVSHVGVFVDAGSRYETLENNGISHFYESVALKSTENRSAFRLVREMSKLGANVACAAQRDSVAFSGDVLRPYLPEVVGTLADVIQNSTFPEHELAYARANYQSIHGENLKQPDQIIMQAIHEAAYGSNHGLGLPLYAPAHNLENFSTSSMKDYLRTFFTPKRMIVNGVGVNHQELVSLVDQLFAHLPQDVNVQRVTDEYTGGEVRLNSRDGDGSVHLALAFRAPSWHDKDLVPLCVLQMAMGGGGSFSAGGPGKGMYSRLYENVLNHHGWVNNINCFATIYNDTALFGIYGTSHGEDGSRLAEVLVTEAKRMADKTIPQEELQRAKNQLKSAVTMQLESRTLLQEDLGRQLHVYGAYKSAATMCKEIDAVTVKDIERVAQALLRTRPSLAGYGDLSNVPNYDSIHSNIRG